MDILTCLHRWRASLGHGLLTLLLALSSGAGLAATPLETAVKAAYLGKFGLYTSWPDKAFAAADAARLCLFGDDPFGQQLEQNVAKQRVQDRPVQIRRLSNPEQVAGCHIIFINEPDAQLRSQILDSLRGSSALTVTDTKGPGTGIINFVLKDNRVRFDVDDAAAAQAGLNISSKLLRLALTVKPRP